MLWNICRLQITILFWKLGTAYNVFVIAMKLHTNNIKPRFLLCKNKSVTFGQSISIYIYIYRYIYHNVWLEFMMFSSKLYQDKTNLKINNINPVLIIFICYISAMTNILDRSPGFVGKYCYLQLVLNKYLKPELE